jgi:hypothetical protein
MSAAETGTVGGLDASSEAILPLAQDYSAPTS